LCKKEEPISKTSIRMKYGIHHPNRRDYEMAQYQITEIFELLHHLFFEKNQGFGDGGTCGINLESNPS